MKGRYLIMSAMGLFLFFGQACEKVTLETGPVPDVVSFADHIVPIFEGKCIQCHNGGAIKPDLRADKAYESLEDENLLGSPDSNPLNTKMQQGHGNPTPLEVQIIVKWLEQGAPEN